MAALRPVGVNAAMAADARRRAQLVRRARIDRREPARKQISGEQEREQPRRDHRRRSSLVGDGDGCLDLHMTAAERVRRSTRAPAWHHPRPCPSRSSRPSTCRSRPRAGRPCRRRGAGATTTGKTPRAPSPSRIAPTGARAGGRRRHRGRRRRVPQRPGEGRGLSAAALGRLVRQRVGERRQAGLLDERDRLRVEVPHLFGDREGKRAPARIASHPAMSGVHRPSTVGKGRLSFAETRTAVMVVNLVRTRSAAVASAAACLPLPATAAARESAADMKQSLAALRARISVRHLGQVGTGDGVLGRDRQRLAELGLEHLRRGDALLLPGGDFFEALLLERGVVARRRGDEELHVGDAQVVVLLARVDRLHLQLDRLERAGRLLDDDLLPVRRCPST